MASANSPDFASKVQIRSANLLGIYLEGKNRPKPLKISGFAHAIRHTEKCQVKSALKAILGQMAESKNRTDFSRGWKHAARTYSNKTHPTMPLEYVFPAFIQGQPPNSPSTCSRWWYMPLILARFSTLRRRWKTGPLLFFSFLPLNWFCALIALFSDSMSLLSTTTSFTFIFSNSCCVCQMRSHKCLAGPSCSGWNQDKEGSIQICASMQFHRCYCRIRLLHENHVEVTPSRHHTTDKLTLRSLDSTNITMLQLPVRGDGWRETRTRPRRGSRSPTYHRRFRHHSVTVSGSLWYLLEY